MKKVEKQTLYFLGAWLLLLGYPPSVLAAEIMLGPLDIPMVKYMYVVWMASWGSCAAFLQKVATGTIDKNWKNIFLHASNDIINANLAAVLVFMACQHYGVPKPLEAISYTLAGYGGATMMAFMYRKWISTGSTLLSKALGTPAQADDTVPPAAS